MYEQHKANKGNSIAHVVSAALPPTKPSSAHPSRRPSNTTRMMPNNRAKMARMMSSRAPVPDRKIFHNKTTVASIRVGEDQETKAITNSHLWNDLGQSASHSYIVSNSRLPTATGLMINPASTAELMGSKN